MRILIVDDDSAIRSLISEVAGNLYPEATFIICSSGNEATDMIIAVRPKIVITDWNMPHGNGELVVTAAVTAGLPKQNIIVITGGSISSEQTSVNAKCAFEHGAGEVLRKPFDLKELTKILKRIS